MDLSKGGAEVRSLTSLEVGLGRWWGLGGGGPDSWVVYAWEESLLAYPVINVE